MCFLTRCAHNAYDVQLSMDARGQLLPRGEYSRRDVTCDSNSNSNKRSNKFLLLRLTVSTERYLKYDYLEIQGSN